MTKFLLFLPLALMLAGCGGADVNEIPDTQSGAYSEVVVTWQGRELHCLRFDTGTGQADDSGISCDWVAFHKDNR